MHLYAPLQKPQDPPQRNSERNGAYDLAPLDGEELARIIPAGLISASSRFRRRERNSSCPRWSFKPSDTSASPESNKPQLSLAECRIGRTIGLNMCALHSLNVLFFEENHGLAVWLKEACCSSHDCTPVWGNTSNHSALHARPYSFRQLPMVGPNPASRTSMPTIKLEAMGVWSKKIPPGNRGQQI